MKKGFTLIELLVVIVLLSLISLVVFPSIFNAIKESKETAYKSQKEIILKASKEYCLNHTDLLPEPSEGQSNIFSIDILLKEGYLAQDEIINPKTSKKLNGQIKVTYHKNQYIYRFIENKN